MGHKTVICLVKQKHINIVLDIAMLCDKLEIPLRGHRETGDALNNFLELFKFMSKYAPEIENRMNELPRNAALMSHHIQEELLEQQHPDHFVR